MTTSYSAKTQPQPPVNDYAPAAAHSFGSQYLVVPQRDYSGWAVTGFVLSLLGFGAVSLVLSIIGLQVTKSGEKRGKGLAIAGTAISGVTVAFIFFIWLVLFASAASSSAPGV